MSPAKAPTADSADGGKRSAAVKNIVLLSDGTGNSAAKRHKTNVWRLYEALDLHRDDQIAFYDDGVGAQQFLPLKLLGGAFGWGLKRNVIRLYEVLCRNWRRGDRIYLFGYSRGAFTVRMLAGLVEDQGIYTDFADERDLSEVARRRFEAYRLENGKGWLTYPVRKWLVGRREPREPCEPRQAGESPEIEFIGVWDTVEAYGFPITELAAFWDFLVLPLRFVKRSVPKNVRRACHALAIDEDRQSFHPVLWREDASPECRAANRAEIEQVWFAGSHGDVGGGHPRHELALAPLDWMISKVETPEEGDDQNESEGSGLYFRPVLRNEFRRRSDWHGALHNSRSGLGAYYRYRPRDIEDLSAEAGVGPGEVGIHRAVLERIRHRGFPYAPTALPETYRVVETLVAHPEWPRRQEDYESKREARRRMARMEAAHDMVFLRRWLYTAFLVATFLPGGRLRRRPRAVAERLLVERSLDGRGGRRGCSVRPQARGREGDKSARRGGLVSGGERRRPPALAAGNHVVAAAILRAAGGAGADEGCAQRDSGSRLVPRTGKRSQPGGVLGARSACAASSVPFVSPAMRTQRKQGIEERRHRSFLDRRTVLRKRHPVEEGAGLPHPRGRG